MLLGRRRRGHLCRRRRDPGASGAATAHLRGAEAVIDKDLGAALLAQDLDADALLILTDVANVEIGFGTDEAHPIGRTTPAALRAQVVPGRVDGPQGRGGLPLRRGDGEPAMIGRLDQAADLVRGTCGTVIEREATSGRTL